MKRLGILIFSICLPGLAQAQLRVASMHPLMGDLARQVGGEYVEVVDLVDPNKSIHTFAPTPKTLKEAAGARIVLASGKHLEDSWLDKVTDNLDPSAEVIEVGRTIPSLLIDRKKAMFACCPAHAAGKIDPHWWHRVANMKRAARVVSSAFSKADPVNKKNYEARARAYGKTLDELHSWIKKEVATIPRDDRELSTAHLAFAYFCKEYGFIAIPILGVNAEQDPSPKQLAETILHLKDYAVVAIFPEQNANPKALEAMERETGVVMGGTLLADNLSKEVPTYVDLMKANVETIVKGLTVDP